MVQNELDDEMRLQIAQALKEKIEKSVKRKSMVVYHKRMLDD